MTLIADLSKFRHCLIALAILLVASSSPVAFKDVLQNPRAYHHQRVSVSGVARVEGESFVLYDNLRDAEKLAGPSKAISVAQKVNERTHDDLDNHWVTITGIVDADRHGMWNYSCEILLENVQALRRPAGKKRIVITGTFRNQTSTSVHVALRDTKAGKYAEFELGPTGIDEVAIQGGSVEATDLAGKLVAQLKLLSPNANAYYYDPARHTYFYRISDGKIERVPPNEGKKWTKRGPP